jgi:L-ascorbate metabolism protein UlaG (beta-lactamase superfamily)
MEGNMRIKWLGHSCFLLTSDNNTRIITDPFDAKVGYRIPKEEADIVTVSHDHYDHNNIGVVKGFSVHVRETGKQTVKEIGINGVATFHDAQQGSKRGKNIIFTFGIDGVRVCHCGDLGHALTHEQVKEIGQVDVLLVPVGGIYTIDAAGAYEVVKQLKPAVTIPMHFKTQALSFPLEGADRFVATMGNGVRPGKQELTVDKAKLHELPGTIVLDYQ